MGNSVHDINLYAFANSDQLLLDTNVWMFIHGPQKPGDARAAVYSGALARILAAQSAIHIDVLIVSEFINSYARLRYNILRSSGAVSLDFKPFRKTAGFKPIARDVADAVRRVLKSCARTESLFSTCDVDSMVNEYEKGNSDFNDQVLTEMCKSNGWKLVTDDGDFKGRGVPLVTANKALLI